MPDQNEQTQNNQSAPVVEEITIPATSQPQTQSVPKQEPPTPDGTPFPFIGLGEEGSVVPPSNLPPVITPSPKKKFGTKRIIATILGLLVLIGGLGTGLILVRQRQDIREKAAGTTLNANNCQVATGQTSCQTSVSWDFEAAENTNYLIKASISGQANEVDVKGIWHVIRWRDNAQQCADECGSVGCKVNDESSCSRKCGYPGCQMQQNGSTPFTLECGKTYTFRLRDLDAGGASIAETGSVQATGCNASTPTPTPEPQAQCINIQSFDTNWTKITDLSKLKAGDKIRFTVAGSSTAGIFDKARFTINGTLRPEVAGTRPSSNPIEFFDEYTIPAGTTAFTVKAELHHSTLGWF